jgi:phospholipid/cholesterol/gamma-HCH transport system ATP-binding protein
VATNEAVSRIVEPMVAFEHVSLAFDDNVVLRDVSFAVQRGEMKILLGGSGSGKSVTLKLILGLLKPDSGTICVDGRRIDNASEDELRTVRAGIGMLFQESALFDSLSVAGNVGYRLAEETDTPPAEVRRRVEEVLGFIGLEDYIDQMPSELSGGQRRRVAIGRALAHRPSLLLIDDPTSGLDPITARTIDALVIRLRDLENVTCIAVTHQLRDALYVATHQAVRQTGAVAIRPLEDDNAAKAGFIMLKDAGVYFDGTAAELRASADPYVRRFLADPSRNLVPQAA